MLFNSFIFWIFFLVVITIYRRLGHTAQNRLLLVASYIFYGFWDYRFLSLIFMSTVVDYYAAKSIGATNEESKRKKWLYISVAFNLGMLGFFKYWNFFIEEFSGLLGILGFNSSIPMLNVVLPVGISFYTFQTMSYTIDVYKGVTKPTNKFLDFALYVSFFPQLVAGPIERSRHLLPQVLLKRSTNDGDYSEGFYHVLTGLFKKVVIADNMAPIVNTVFSTPTADLTGPEIVIGVYAFAFQIYGDFSGYSSIAKGIAKWMGFDLMWNFKNPYFSVSPSDFWSRWHISLSSWLRDYLYIPLGGSRLGRRKTLRNLVLTMGLGGLWHGAGWTFITWGLYHGMLLVVYRVFKRPARSQEKQGSSNGISRALRMILFFQLICISWLLFRAESMDQVWSMVLMVFSDLTFTGFTWYGLAMIAFFVTPVLALEYWTERSGNLLVLLDASWMIRLVVYSYLILMLIIFPPLVSQEFIYFQF
jgi:D-alanyl-lipoteichoic acid acyltransferase DltB (MBOAT superfamily)